eukprot:711283-Prymnesium_polylepis.1
MVASGQSQLVRLGAVRARGGLGGGETVEGLVPDPGRCCRSAARFQSAIDHRITESAVTVAPMAVSERMGS